MEEMKCSVHGRPIILEAISNFSLSCTALSLSFTRIERILHGEKIIFCFMCSETFRDFTQLLVSLQNPHGVQINLRF